MDIEKTTTGVEALTAQDSDFRYLEAMDDLVRIVDAKGHVLFENETMRRFTEMADDDAPFFPLSTATGSFTEQAVTMTELCVAGHVFAIKNSPLIEAGKVTAVIQVFRDTTIQNSMTMRLVETNRKLKNEIVLARSIQEKMLPRLTGYGRLAFDFYYRPTEELSGDFFDVVPLGQGRLGLYISDVVGHGVSASILTMFVRQTMRSILQEERIREPATVLHLMRERFRAIRMGEGQYFSLFFALFDTMEDTVTYANAGHACLPIVERNGQIDRLDVTGRLITWEGDRYVYKQKIRTLEGGERFLFYTDGASETRSAAGTEYGEKNLQHFMKQTTGSPLSRIVTDVEQFGVGEPKDDIALVYVENQRRDA
ncbi:MAG: PP2C family protein-serine/threonine phosphatase [Peptoniphilaceae bacterium]|nr:PP2C family protein-serine/threonine phosphatase [Peptoniphilaceae bacterium]MDY6085665.1 PP2C family protein-serine/threonine phosphatase [Peptoniphilaceae bacterium]